MRAYCPWCMSPIQADGLCPACGKKPADYQPSSHHFPPGKLLRDRYLVGRCLGEGGFGITYLGTDTNLERRVAIKEYFPTSFVKREVSVSLDVTCYTNVGRDFYEKGRDQFLQEARTMAKLENIPEIVRVLDFFPANNTAYIVMEFLEGSTLKELVAEQGRIPAKTMLEMLEPVLRAMESMHSAGIIHRDISPDNLMVLKNGKVKLMDFGCARDIEGGRTMTVTLKHGFAPMEQYTGHGQGPWSDVYALCATIYYCLTGKVPPRSVERSDSEQDPLTPPNKLGANLSPTQEQALMKGLAVRARNRWQSAANLYAALYEKTMDGFPWTPPQEEDPAAESKTEYITPGQGGGEDQEETIQEPACEQEPGGTEYVQPVAQPDTDTKSGNHESKKTSPLARIAALPKGAKVGIAAAACLVFILTAVLAMGGSSTANFPQEEEQDTPAMGTAAPSASSDGDTSEQEPSDDPTGDDAGKLPGIADLQTNTGDTSADPQPEQEDPAPSARQESNTQTPAGQTTQPSTPKDTNNNSGTSTSSSNNSGSSTSVQTAPPASTSAPSQASASEFTHAGVKAYVDYSYDEAFPLLQQGADLGDEVAMYYLGKCYQYGYGIEKSITSAIAWYEKAVNAGSQASEAVRALAEGYDFGFPDEFKDDSLAFKWYMKMAEMGDSTGYVRVAEAYAYGTGVAQDFDEAERWYTKYYDGDAEKAKDKVDSIASAQGQSR